MDFNNGKCMLDWQQGLFEGMKAYRSEDGRILLFRPEENAMRMISGADRMSMPAPDVSTFVNAVKQTVLANKRWVISGLTNIDQQSRSKFWFFCEETEFVKCAKCHVN